MFGNRRPAPQVQISLKSKFRPLLIRLLTWQRAYDVVLMTEYFDISPTRGTHPPVTNAIIIRLQMFYEILHLFQIIVKKETRRDLFVAFTIPEAKSLDF
ncbi:hypothetical protein L2E82_31274 [Cichorium intybus]|uniref:Uncharacterized protein n=1 Tax=Cichorium intybus TaxID=13427 RepID=A0ACB9D2T5_CICIN|nr:hypothetical protein L2E82_31274 [Cichorium intybus]